MWALLTSKVGRLVAALLTALTILVGVFQFGRKAQRDDDHVEELNEYIETKKRIDNVQVSPDRDAAIDRLRDNGLIR